MIRCFVLLLAALLAACPVSVASAQQRTFQAWNAACGNNGCNANTFTPGGRVALRFSRANGPDAAWRVSFTGIQTDIRPGSAIGVSIDYGPYERFAANSGYRIVQGGVALAGVTGASPLLSALKAGGRATLEFTHREGFPLRLDFSLSGLSAALLWIDERQGRIGVEPPVASDEQAPGSAPPAPDAPGGEAATGEAAPETPPETVQQQSVPSSVPAIVEKAHLADKECRDYREKHLVESREIDRLDKDRVLYVLPCYTGAYNTIYRVYVHDGRYADEVKRELFPGYSDEQGWYGRDTLINVSYDAETKTLRAFEKGRGLGDCGSAPEFQWLKTGFWRLVEYRYWGKCDGSHMPEQWPVIFKHPEAEE